MYFAVLVESVISFSNDSNLLRTIYSHEGDLLYFRLRFFASLHFRPLTARFIPRPYIQAQIPWSCGFTQMKRIGTLKLCKVIQNCNRMQYSVGVKCVPETLNYSESCQCIFNIEHNTRTKFNCDFVEIKRGSLYNLAVTKWINFCIHLKLFVTLPTDITQKSSLPCLLTKLFPKQSKFLSYNEIVLQMDKNT